MSLEITDKLEQARSVKLSAQEITTEFDYMIDLIQKMKALLSLSASSLNSYDLQQSQKVSLLADPITRPVIFAPIQSLTIII